MQATTSKNPIHSRILKTETVSWKNIQFLQKQDFKNFSAEEKSRLRNSIENNDFIQPFYVWNSGEGIMYGLDGYHRALILTELEAEEALVPEQLPATFIDCESKEEAAKLVLLFSSQYAHISLGGFENFLNEYNLNADEMSLQISFPDMEISDEMPFPDNLTFDGKNKPATIKITFESAQQLEEIKPDLEKFLTERSPDILLSVSCGEI